MFAEVVMNIYNKFSNIEIEAVQGDIARQPGVSARSKFRIRPADEDSGGNF